MSDPQRERRVGLNEALFREINERLEELAERSAPRHQHLDLVCECGDRDCADRITLTVAEYTRLRSDPLLFVVLPGHDDRQVEDVVERETAWWIVRKRPGQPAAIAAATAE